MELVGKYDPETDRAKIKNAALCIYSDLSCRFTQKLIQVQKIHDSELIKKFHLMIIKLKKM